MTSPNWPPAGHDRDRELFDDDGEPCEPAAAVEDVDPVVDRHFRRRQCAICGGRIRHIRTTIEHDGHLLIDTYRCGKFDFEDSCRQGGHRVRDRGRSGETIRIVGPIFEG